MLLNFIISGIVLSIEPDFVLPACTDTSIIFTMYIKPLKEGIVLGSELGKDNGIREILGSKLGLLLGEEEGILLGKEDGFEIGS